MDGGIRMVSLLTRDVRPGALARFDPDASRRTINESLAALREHFDMEVAFVGRFGHGRRWFEYVSTDASFCPVQPGGSDRLEDSYCARVVDGRAPGLMTDAREEPSVADLAATFAMPVGAHLSVPLHLEDGSVFGTLCCFSRQPDPELRERDLDVLTMVADVLGGHLGFLLEHEQTFSLALDRVTGVLAGDGPAMALQPLVDLRGGRVVGYEALARFPEEAGWTPDRWFAEAGALGLGPQLEGAAVRSALRLLPDLPPGTSMAVNLSPEALCSDDRIVDRLADSSPHRVVVELTEHARVAYSQQLTDRLVALREAGIRIAVDDAGSGYAGLEHILHLGPEVLKLDRVLVQGIAAHPGRQAMCEAMVRFTQRTGAELVAEGVETDADLEELRRLGVGLAQGFLLGRPRLAS